ncbi:MAG: response regulator [Magnetococcus sp. YQC-5]
MEQQASVLIVDDTETNIDMLLGILDDQYEISVAMDGPSALEIVWDDPPDIILLDIMMPGMDGYEVCRRLKADLKTKNIPVIFITAKTDVADETLGFQLGGVDYITKPISPSVVIARVATHIKLKQTSDKLALQNQNLEASNALLNSTISQLKATQEELILNEKMASLGRMVAGFAHEVNTPIGVAFSASTQLMEESKAMQALLNQDEIDFDDLTSSVGTVGELSSLLTRNLQRSIELIQSFKRTSIDQSSEAERTYSISDVVNDVLISLSNQFKKTSIRFDVHCPEGLYLIGVPGYLHQILTNLLMNSLIHGFSGGTLPGVVTIRFKVDGNFLCFYYADSGKGMSEEIRSKAFEPFFTTNRSSGGSGLGLYICYSIITSKFQGSVLLTSAPGKGIQLECRWPITVGS